MYEMTNAHEGLKSNREIKRERNELTSQMISQLKQECARPEVVEVWDIRARDPKLLVYLKAYRNTVPVPRHWSQKRKYLQGKRGIEKAPFELPSFIQSTGMRTYCDCGNVNVGAFIMRTGLRPLNFCCDLIAVRPNNLSDA